MRFAGASLGIPSVVGQDHNVRLIGIKPAVGTVVDGGNVCDVVPESSLVLSVDFGDDDNESEDFVDGEELPTVITVTKISRRMVETAPAPIASRRFLLKSRIDHFCESISEPNTLGSFAGSGSFLEFALLTFESTVVI